ncbi:diacylglycerol/lipid kinase family protein [Segetibacter koreensis]|uniref:diacylglycerol/lipid kinase family protein n=1 Tax=Segetibacter koreensis TaxID=398037 RepID=UPI00036BEC5E|nr:diacylglycerol kinase family protein [Segetibacter koreensis]
MPSTLLFVINPVSGGRQKTEYEDAIKKYYEKLPHKVKYFLLNGKNDAEELDKCIEQEKPHKVVAVGGDGTVSMVAKKILGTDMQLAILPAGSANGMARELNISLNIEEALDTVEKGKVKKIDAICINNEICLHLSDIGLNARLIKYFEEGNMRGKWGYAKVALKVLLRKQNIRVIIKAKEKEIKRDAFMVVLANASKYGTGAVINPKGDLFDGLFEVVIIRQLGFSTLLKVWFRPRNLDPKKIEVIQAESVQIHTHRKVDFQVDGEYIGKVNEVNADILPAILNIILPE